MKNYLKHAGSDIPAAVVVFLVALPLCLGIAGIIAGMVGGIVISSLSGSQLSLSGPAAGLTVIVASAIIKLQVFEAFLLAVVLAGMIQLVLGYIKAGVIGDYIPNSVIKGMLAAIGLILILKQLPHFVGYDVNYSGDESFSQSDNENTFTGIFHSLNFITPAAIIIGIVSILILKVWESEFFKSSKILKLIPGPLVVVLVSVFLSQVLSASAGLQLQQKHLVSLPVAENASMFLSFFNFPDIPFIKNPDVWISAFTIAIVASLETLLGIEAIDKLDPLKRVTPTN